MSQRIEMEPPTPGKPLADVHSGLHSEQGANRGEHSGRHRNPIIKVEDLAWLEFEKPDLIRAEQFAVDFGFSVADRTPEALYLRGTWSRTPCLVIRRGPKSRFVGITFQASESSDLDRLAHAQSTDVRPFLDGKAVELIDPSGVPVRVVHGLQVLPALPDQVPLIANYGTQPLRFNATQRALKEPARVQRLGHLVLVSRTFQKALDWYLENLGMIVSDFLYLDDLRERGPTMAFIRCDRGSIPSDHHTLAMHLGPANGYVHSAYQVSDLDALALGGEFLKSRGYDRTWGIGRHIQGSQIFDYWRDPDRLMFEHFADGDLFSCDEEPGWARMSASGLSQWGPPVTKDFLGSRPNPALIANVIGALRGENEIDPTMLKNLMKAMSS